MKRKNLKSEQKNRTEKDDVQALRLHSLKKVVAGTNKKKAEAASKETQLSEAASQYLTDADGDVNSAIEAALLHQDQASLDKLLALQETITKQREEAFKQREEAELEKALSDSRVQLKKERGARKAAAKAKKDAENNIQEID